MAISDFSLYVLSHSRDRFYLFVYLYSALLEILSEYLQNLICFLELPFYPLVAVFSGDIVKLNICP